MLQQQLRYTITLVLSSFLALIPQAALAWPTCKSATFIRGHCEDLGVDAGMVHDLDALLEEAVASHKTQSIAAAVVYQGKLIYLGTAGGAKPDSVFDLASVTKVLATTPSVMWLYEQQKLRLEEPISKKLKWLDTPDKRTIKIAHLLLHTSGLFSVVYRGKIDDGKDVILSRIRQSKMRARPGEKYRYSDLGFIILGELVSKTSGMPLDQFTEKLIYQPLGMCDTGYLPPASMRSRLISPWPHGENPGQVYDPLAARLGGVAGHAGLFSTVENVALFGQMMLNLGELNGTKLFEPATVRLMVKPHLLPGHSHRKRGLGWDLPSRRGSTEVLSKKAYGHTGFTGTSLWIDPLKHLVLVLLTNRTFYEPAANVLPLRSRFHRMVVGALMNKPHRPVLTGLDRLVASNFKLLRRQRVGLITNQSAVDRTGKWIVSRLASSKRVKLKAIFVPEHGLKAELDRHIQDSNLKVQGKRIPVFSLFGSRRRPTHKTLRGIDTLVFDVPTVGVRYYTYLATMGWAMEEAARRKIRFVVLDRPNPLGGQAVQGPVASSTKETSTNYYPLPVRYGMTTGELAQLYKKERKIRVNLKVVRVKGWKRSEIFPQTGLPWRNPSPNIRSFRQALLYAGIGLLEGTNLSVGRGTPAPFQTLGAPWIDGPRLAQALNHLRIPGVMAFPITFTPKANPYRGEECHGLRFVLTDPRRLSPVVLGIALATLLQKHHAKEWDMSRLSRLVLHPPTIHALLTGRSVKQIAALWRPGLERFLRIRRRFLLY